MKPTRASYTTVYIRFLTMNRVIVVNLKDTIFNEQFGTLSFFLHFLSVQQYATSPNLTFPASGWITLDKQMGIADTVERTFNFGYIEFQDFLKFIKRRVSYDIRCLKKFESELKKNRDTITFIEDIVQTMPELFKRTQLRQLKRIYNQRIALADFKCKTEPSKFHSLENIWEYLVTVADQWAARTVTNPFSERTLEELFRFIQEDDTHNA